MPAGGKICVTQLGSLEVAAAVNLAALVLADNPQPCRQCQGGDVSGSATGFLPCLFAGVPRYCEESP